MAALFTYVSGSSFVYQQQFGLDEQQFGLLFGAGAVWLIAATQLNPVLLRRWSPAQILVAGTVAGAAAAPSCSLLAATGTGGLLAVAVPLWAVLFAAASRCRTPRRSRCPGYGEAAGRPRRCSARSSSGSAPRCHPWSGCSATTPWRWARSS